MLWLLKLQTIKVLGGFKKGISLDKDAQQGSDNIIPQFYFRNIIVVYVVSE